MHTTRAIGPWCKLVTRQPTIAPSDNQVGQGSAQDVYRIRSDCYLDPESYDYFQYYYLYPRTLASVNERIYSSYPWVAGYPGYAYGYGAPWGFGGRPLARQFPGP